MTNCIHVSVEELYVIAYDILTSFGISKDLAARGARTLNAADARGVDSHGVARLTYYDRCIKSGEINTRPEVKIIKQTPVSAYYDCDYGIGIATADILMDKAIEMAKKSGIGIATGKNGHHFGVAGYYALKAAEQGLIGFSCAPSLLLAAPTGGKEKMIGNSPNSIAFPAGNKTPSMMMDMASTMVAGGKIQMAVRKGEKVPFGWILDENGFDTDDPTTFEDKDTGKILGSLLPMAGPKGYCIIVMIELLSSILSGAKTGPNLIGGGAGLGYFMAAIDPQIIRPLDELKSDLDDYYYMIKNTPRKDGVNEIYLPGEIEYNNTQKRLKGGIDLNINVAQDLLNLMIKYNKLPQNSGIKDLFKEAVNLA